MKLTGGKARGRVLPGKVGSGIRPTSARVREAWFSMVGQRLDGRSFLDAYSGSGIMALEAWSRGADVVCVERERRHVRAICERCAAIGAELEVITGDALAVKRPFDIVWADPPYKLDPAGIAPILGALATEVFGIETARAATLPIVRGVEPRSRRFGDTELHLYRFES